MLCLTQNSHLGETSENIQIKRKKAQVHCVLSDSQTPDPCPSVPRAPLTPAPGCQSSSCGADDRGRWRACACTPHLHISHGVIHSVSPLFTGSPPAPAHWQGRRQAGPSKPGGSLLQSPLDFKAENPGMAPTVPSTLPQGSPSCPVPESSIPALLPRTAWGQTWMAREGDQGARRRPS